MIQVPEELLDEVIEVLYKHWFVYDGDDEFNDEKVIALTKKLEKLKNDSKTNQT